ncbi:ybbR-like protein [Prevotella sp. CAG:891]|jgi:YbbR domain-containing protein|nr:YbbR-like domain-containing protein [Prevotellamassilia sp.]CDE87868.1 ybbR-like protein [Prevotella sp. CAG:891]
MSLPPFVRYCLSKIWNKQFLIFLFFLALSSVFWIFQTLNETYEEDFQVPLELRNVPSNVVITTDLPENLHILLRDKGSQLLAYRYTRQFKPVVVDYNTYSNPSGHVSILGNELQRQIAAQLLPGTQMLGLKPDTLDFYYNFGQFKRVPIRPLGEVRAGRLYSLAKTVYSEDSVTVYASREQLDTITAAYLQPFNLRNLTDTTHVKSNFVKVKGAKFVPAQIGVTFCIDRLVEKTIQVPVQQVNFPASKQLRTFPATVKVTFQVGMGLYRKITSENFVLVVNYEDLLKNKSTYCHLSLKTIPEGVSHVRISPQDVEYVIEEIPDYEQQPEND